MATNEIKTLKKHGFENTYTKTGIKTPEFNTS